MQPDRTGLALGSRAEHSARTKQGMQAARRAGVHVGRPSLVDDQTIGRILEYRGRGESYRLIAEALDADRVPTPGGGARWTARAVRDLYLRNRSRTNEGDAP